MKPKRRTRRLFIPLCITAGMLVLFALLLHAMVWEHPPRVTPVCEQVDPQDVGNVVKQGDMVVDCLRRNGE
jgi:hypothetical protein